jgi:hypothetical protein
MNDSGLVGDETMICSLFIVHRSFLQLVRAAGRANGRERVGLVAVGALVSCAAAEHLFAAASAAAHDDLIFLNFAAKPA